MKKIFLFFGLISLFCFSCSNTDEQAEDCLNYKHALITNVQVDESIVEVNQDLPIELKYFIENSCGSFYDFEVNREGKVYDIKVKTKYLGCQCNEIATEVKTVYHFRASEPGDYTLKFYTTNSEFITQNITVQ